MACWCTGAVLVDGGVLLKRGRAVGQRSCWCTGAVLVDGGVLLKRGRVLDRGRAGAQGPCWCTGAVLLDRVRAGAQWRSTTRCSTTVLVGVGRHQSRECL